MKLNLNNFFSYYFIPFILIIISFITPTKAYFNFTGRVAEILLIIILFAKPIAILTKSKLITKILPCRRHLGVLIFWFAFIHTAGLIYRLNITKLSYYWGLENHLFWAAIAMIGMFLLAITSNKISVRYFKRNWKKFQYLAYLVLFATLAHIAIVTGELIKYVVITIVFVLLKVLEFRKLKAT